MLKNEEKINIKITHKHYVFMAQTQMRISNLCFTKCVSQKKHLMLFRILNTSSIKNYKSFLTGTRIHVRRR